MKKAIQPFAPLAALLVLLALLGCLNSFAQSVPQLINYQGQLLDAAGVPMPNGDYDIEVRLFPVDTGGVALWGPQIFNGASGTGFRPRVPVVQGRFNMIVGPQDTTARDISTVFSSNQSVYVEIKVGSASPISPRQQVLSAPYALKAANSTQLAGFGWESLFTDTGRPDTGHIPGSQIADTAITRSKIAADAVGTVQLTNGAVTPPKLNLQAGKVAIGLASTTYALEVTGESKYTAGSTMVLLNSGAFAVYVGIGNVNINGTLSKSAGSFRIDHPLDPANKYLYHSFVESPDMKNIYDGVVVLDSQGQASVTLPDWFEALNKDFRYQLTPIGSAAPGLHISQEVSHNHFTISGGAKGLRVSWQVTGTRQDAYANAHRIPVEEDKSPEVRGQYLHPEEHGQPLGKRVNAFNDAQAKGTKN
jgi:hypothetical protein